MTLCIVCRNREAAAPSRFGVCQRCANALSEDGHALSPHKLAPEAMTEEILAELRDRVARLVDGVSVERELSEAEVEALFQNLPL